MVIKEGPIKALSELPGEARARVEAVTYTNKKVDGPDIEAAIQQCRLGNARDEIGHALKRAWREAYEAGFNAGRKSTGN